MKIFAQRIFNGEHFTGPATVEVLDGRIVSVLEGEISPDIRLPYGVLGPGLIDLHNNGAFGVDCATATPEEWDRFVEGLANCGVTAVLPTVITAPLPAIAEASTRLYSAMQRHPGLLGLHLEGPFLAPSKRGAHQQEWLQNPTPNALDELLNGPAGKVLKLITLAPECPYALAAIARLTQAGIKVSLGHTDANAEQMREASHAGARLVTHLFNAQSPMSHRSVGAPGVGLTDPLLSPCVIVDGIHVKPELLQIVFAACPRAIAVTDSIPLAGLTPGTTMEFGGALALLAPDGVGRRADGTIAGATITLDEGIRRLIRFGISPEIALAAGTSRPAAALGLNCGSIKAGASADLVWWSDDFHPLQVWLAGKSQSSRNPPGTETARTDLATLESRPTQEIVSLFVAQEQTALRALQAVIPALSKLIDAVCGRMKTGGRLFYVGAGTSGRLGFLDAVECRPTFGIDSGVIIPLLAGGPQAFIQAAEGAEDNAEAAIAALQEHGFNAADTLIGIAASGSTAFTLSAIKHARALGGLTGAITNNVNTPMGNAADIAVEIASGPEIIAGSTRLSAGTTEKIALNILSSTVMIGLGKTYGPYMVDMMASNAKLHRRAIKIVTDVTGVDEASALNSLKICGMSVKLAILCIKAQLTPDVAKQRLECHQGSLSRALHVDLDENHGSISPDQ